MFHIETANWSKKYPLSAQKVKKITAKDPCKHWSKWWEEVTKTQGEQSITLTGCKNCGHVLTTGEIEAVKREEANYPKQKHYVQD